MTGYVEFGAQRLQALEIAVGNGFLEPAVVEFLQRTAHAQGFAQGVGAAGRVVQQIDVRADVIADGTRTRRCWCPGDRTSGL